MPQIVVENLVKTFKIAKRDQGSWGALKGLFHREYQTITALDGVTFSLEPGELLGYIGPNGAGKSTTVKILSGILAPDSGRVTVLGRTPWTNRVPTVAEIGVVFGQRTQLWWDLPLAESFDLLRDIYRIPSGNFQAKLNELSVLLELEPFMDTPVRQLSLGQRMRGDLAASLLHSPKILFLDEPTIGLDASSKLAVRDFIQTLNRQHGVTVILTTHDMDDIENLCRRIIVISRGGIFLDGTIGDLRSKVSSERLLIVDLENAGETIALEQVTEVKRDGHRVWLSFDPDTLPAHALIARVTEKHAIRDLYVENPPIEEIVAKLYRGTRT